MPEKQRKVRFSWISLSCVGREKWLLFLFTAQCGLSIAYLKSSSSYGVKMALEGGVENKKSEKQGLLKSTEGKE